MVGDGQHWRSGYASGHYGATKVVTTMTLDEVVNILCQAQSVIIVPGIRVGGGQGTVPSGGNGGLVGQSWQEGDSWYL